MSGSFNNLRTFRQQEARFPTAGQRPQGSPHLAGNGFGHSREARHQRSHEIRPNREEQIEGTDAIRAARNMVSAEEFPKAFQVLKEAFPKCKTLEGQLRVLRKIIEIVKNPKLEDKTTVEEQLKFCEAQLVHLKPANRDYPTPPAQHLAGLIAQAKKAKDL